MEGEVNRNGGGDDQEKVVAQKKLTVTVTVNGELVEIERRDSDSDWDDDDVITVEEDDDDEFMKSRKAPKELRCYRCWIPKKGTFKNEKKYWTHVDRHIAYGLFSCPTCQRTFSKLNYCIAHEVRMHGDTVPLESKDPVIKMAKLDAKLREELKKKSGKDKEDETYGGAGLKEDLKFYDNRFVCSTSLYPYRGPEVNTVLEAYEIQNTLAPPKSRRINWTAKIAVEKHRLNVERQMDIMRLGRFSEKKGKSIELEVEATESQAQAPLPAPPPLPSNSAPRIKRPMDKGKEEGKRKTKRPRYIEILSSSSSSEDSDYKPAPKRRRSQSSSSKSLQKNGRGQKIKLFPALLNPECRLCNYIWVTDQDLRAHRDSKHPNVKLIDLMAVPPPKKPVSQEENVEEVPAPEVDVPVSEEKDALDKDNGSIDDEVPVSIEETPKPKPKFPLPDSTYSMKETFLHKLGLLNTVRVQLHNKKSVAELEKAIPKCTVEIERLSGSQLAAIQRRNQANMDLEVEERLENLFPRHFMLG